MAKVTLNDIAKNADVSISSVFRALHDMPDISIESKNYILQIAEQMGYEKKNSWKKGLSLIIVMPINPRYFWEPLAESMKHALVQSKIIPKFVFYADFFSEEEVLCCLERAEKMNGDIYAVVPCRSKKVDIVLERIAQKAPLFLLSEKAQIDYTAYIGCDYYQDGVAFANSCQEIIKHFPSVISINFNDNYVVSERNKGFYNQVTKNLKGISMDRAVQVSYDRILAAKIAREIYRKYGTDSFNCLYVSQGFIKQTCDALVKLKVKQKIACIGYERPEIKDAAVKNKYVAAYLDQDVYQQGKTCIQVIEKYLFEQEDFSNTKDFYVPSRIYLNPHFDWEETI